MKTTKYIAAFAAVFLAMCALASSCSQPVSNGRATSGGGSSSSGSAPDTRNAIEKELSGSSFSNTAKTITYTFNSGKTKKGKKTGIASSSTRAAGGGSVSFAWSATLDKKITIQFEGSGQEEWTYNSEAGTIKRGTTVLKKDGGSASGSGGSSGGSSSGGGGGGNPSSPPPPPPVTVWTDKSRPNNSSTVFEGERGKIGDTSVGFYRIPAITLTKDGDLLAFTDKRFGDNMDTGYALTTNAEHTEAVNQTSKAANKRGDITMRVSKDAGKTWGPEITAAKGEYQATPNPPNGIYAGHCDAVPVSDIDNPKNIMFLTCSGSSNYSNNNGPNYLLVFKSTDGGASWTWKDITSDIVAATGNSSTKRFFGAGRACQSKIYKFDSHKRVYAHVGINGSGYVMYTDDFGDNWKLLGSKIAGWDEVKITEYGDGSLLVVGKAKGGNHPLTVWRYGTGTDDAKNGTGTFDANQNISIAGTECNGDMIIVKAKDTASGDTVNLVLASYPMGAFSDSPNSSELPSPRSAGAFARWNIGIRWKTFAGDAATLPLSSDFATGWSAKADAYYVQGKDKGDIEGVYSVLQELPNRKIGILYEEGPGTREELKAGTNIPFKGYKYGDWNVIKYQELDISTITGGKYASLL